MKILAISGSLRKQSYNTALLQAARDAAPKEMDIQFADITAVPAYDSDVQAAGFPAAVIQLASAIREADGVLIATPEYNYSIPGVLKNAIDWVSRVDEQPFDGKAIAIVGASMGNLGAARAQYHLRQIFVFLNGLVMNRPEVFVGAAHEKFDDDGTLIDSETGEFLAGFMRQFAVWIETTKPVARLSA